LMVQVEEEQFMQRRSSRESRTRSAAKSPVVETLPTADSNATVIV